MAEQPEPITITVGEDEARLRLDVYLSRRLADRSRSTIQGWIKSGQVLVDGAASKPGYQVRAGEIIRVSPPAPAPSELLAEPLPLDIVYEDPWLVVVNKPAGLVVHPGAGVSRGTLANALAYHFGQLSQGQTVRPGIVHRLDKNTSGLLVVAKDDRTHELLARQFQRREVEKRYIALVYGHLPKKQGAIDAPLGRDPASRTRISTRSRRPREAITEYEVRREFARFSLLDVTLRTGRTHQIRVHLQHLKHPVVGDETYGGHPRAFLQQPGLVRDIQALGRQFLHAAHLSFFHPALERRMTFEASLPPELAQLLERLE
jgi:23S rRNA pseudouridine1911/1915/1917 synthase